MTESTSTPEPGVAPVPGGQDALATFLASNDALLDRMFSYISRRIPDDPQGAEEVFGDTLEAVAGFVVAKGCPPKEYAPVTFGIADRKVADYWRARSRRAGMVLTAPSDLSLAADALSGKSGDPYERVDTLLDLKRAFEPLSGEQQRALVLRFVDRLTQVEAAAAMAITRARLRRLVDSATKTIMQDRTLDEYRPHPTTTPMRRTTQTGTPEAQA